jgi:large subunit ribosomal protein L22
MESKAVARHIRMSPRKVRLVVDAVRGKKVTDALATLDHTAKAASRVVRKVLKSAIANAEHNLKEDKIEDLRVVAAFVDGGPTLKRFRARAMGRAARILKRTSHVTIIISDGA